MGLRSARGARAGRRGWGGTVRFPIDGATAEATRRRRHAARSSVPNVGVRRTGGTEMSRQGRLRSVPPGA